MYRVTVMQQTLYYHILHQESYVCVVLVYALKDIFCDCALMWLCHQIFRIVCLSCIFLALVFLDKVQINPGWKHCPGCYLISSCTVVPWWWHLCDNNLKQILCKISRLKCFQWLSSIFDAHAQIDETCLTFLG